MNPNNPHNPYGESAIEQDINICPCRGGEADNGHSRDIPLAKLGQGYYWREYEPAPGSPTPMGWTLLCVTAWGFVSGMYWIGNGMIVMARWVGGSL